MDAATCSLTAMLADGKDVPHGREAMIRAALGNAANKVLFQTYDETPPTWRAFAASAMPKHGSPICSAESSRGSLSGREPNGRRDGS